MSNRHSEKVHWYNNAESIPSLVIAVVLLPVAITLAIIFGAIMGLIDYIRERWTLSEKIALLIIVVIVVLAIALTICGIKLPCGRT